MKSGRSNGRLFPQSRYAQKSHLPIQLNEYRSQLDRWRASVLLKGFLLGRFLMADKIANKRITGSLRRRTEAISFLHSLMSGPFQSLDDKEVPPWFEAGKVQQISGTVYTYHCECRRVRWRDVLKFAWANDGQPFVLFWITDCDYFARQLTEEETFRFCQLMDVKRYT